MRFNNYLKAVENLTEALESLKTAPDSLLIRDAIVKRYEICYELAWKLLKDFLEDQGERDIFGAKSAFRLAQNRGLISNGEVWMQMIEDRNVTIHTYANNLSQYMSERILELYLEPLQQLKTRFIKISENP